MPANLLFLPTPRRLNILAGVLPLPNHRLIALDSPSPHRLLFAARQVQQALQQHAGVQWDIVAGSAVPAEKIGLTLRAVPYVTAHPQGYRLAVQPAGVFVEANAPQGVFYAVQTLTQLLAQRGPALPLLHLEDWPDFPHRGVMLDISRDKVPTMDTLTMLVDMLAGWKINQLQLYTEHTFAYQHHPEVWAQASPLTGAEILALDAYCRERFIELVPNQNTFGHMRRWLTHPRYRALAECPHGCDTGHPEWGVFTEPFSLCPGDPGSLVLVRSLMDELLPHFLSRQFNVGCDETVDLGLGRSREAVAQQGKGRVYLDFLLKIYREVKSRGHTMQFWADIVMAYPALTPELPRDLVALEWGYEADHPFADHAARLAAVGMPFYVCPGTSSWNSVAGRTQNALDNLRHAAHSGLAHGAVGYLITDWGDNGHWQPLPVSFLGLAYGAALAWAVETNTGQDAARLTSLHALADPSGRAGRLAADLGNAYLQPGPVLHNGSTLFWLLQQSPAQIRAMPGLTAAGLRQTLDYVDRAAAALPDLPDPRIRREFGWVAAMLRHACRRGLWALGQAGLQPHLARESAGLLAEFQDIWLARNRPGGLPHSLARLEQMRRAYTD